MARANLRGLIGNLGDAETPSATPAEAAQIATAVSPRPPVTSNDTLADVSPGSSKTEDVDVHSTSDSRPHRGRSSPLPVARYSDFERKETRLRVDQQDALTEHARRLSRAKSAGGQRITDNTLIRVAVDLLLSKGDRLAGDDEAGLRRSLGMRDGDG